MTGLSPYYLSRVFHRQTGLPVRRFLNLIRLEVAAHEISTTEDTLEAIAERVGLVDASHLSRLFVRFVGHRPGRARRRPVD